MSKQLTDRVEFDFIRYANCWEDADLLVEALKLQPGDRVLSIASAGDNSFALLAQEPALVVAADINPVQLYLCELKKAAFTLKNHAAFLSFLGFAAGENRTDIYKTLRPQLSVEAQNWWDNHIEIINTGIISQGKFERYFGYFRNKLLPFIHSKKTIAKLFEVKTATEQKEFYDKHWNSWRWRLFFRVFFSRYVMGKYGRDPEFMNEVKLSVSQYIFGKAENHLVKADAQKNLYLHHILTGTFAPQLPLYARAEHFEIIRRNLDRFVVFKGYAEDAIREHGSFSAFNLSNIFEYLPSDTCKAVAQNLCAGATPNARFAYWNLMVPRKLASLLPDQLKYDEAESNALMQKDNGFFYRQFILDHKI
ncbi:MAG: BtaA family protein [Bacteroidota bacterium]|nr:BtaA family protein [Bacteroidota bacterium]